MKTKKRKSFAGVTREKAKAAAVDYRVVHVVAHRVAERHNGRAMMSEPHTPVTCLTSLPNECPAAEPCSSCGTCQDVTFDADPYASEINGDDEPVWLCGECRHERAMDI